MDNDADAGQSYFYKIKAVDRCFNLSGDSAVVGANADAAGLLANYRFEDNVGDDSGNANAPVPFGEQTIDSNAVSPTNQWVYIAVALLGRVGTLYFDGVAVGRNPNMDFPPFQIGRTPRNWIGRSQFLTDPYLNGKVDDFRIYDGALSAEQIAVLAAPTGAQGGR